MHVVALQNFYNLLVGQSLNLQCEKHRKWLYTSSQGLCGNLESAILMPKLICRMQELVEVIRMVDRVIVFDLTLDHRSIGQPQLVRTRRRDLVRFAPSHSKKVKPHGCLIKVKNKLKSTIR